MKNLKSLATGLKHTITTRKLEGDVIENYSMQLKSTTTKGESETPFVCLICTALKNVNVLLKMREKQPRSRYCAIICSKGTSRVCGKKGTSLVFALISFSLIRYR